MQSKRGQSMFDMLPLYYENSALIQSILDAQGVEIDNVRSALDDTLKQFYTSLLTDWGVEHWEKELAITPGTDDIEVRRSIIKAKLLNPLTITVQQLEKIVNCFVPNQDAKVIPYNHYYAFKINMPSYVPENMQTQMLKSVEESKPAHLAAIYTLERKNNQTIYLGHIKQNGLSITILPAKIKDETITANQYFGTAVHTGKNITIKTRRA